MRLLEQKGLLPAPKLQIAGTYPLIIFWCKERLFRAVNKPIYPILTGLSKSLAL